MDKKLISQREYLKKYLSSGKDKKKQKKKKRNLGSKTVRIIDDDIDLKNIRAIEDGEIDIYTNNEDGPQIAGIIDERGPIDFSDKKRWKIITDDGFGDISVTSFNRTEMIPDEARPGNKVTDSRSTNRHSCSIVDDCSPPRKFRRNSDFNEPQTKQSSSKKRRRKVASPVDNRSSSANSDLSPVRKPERNSDSDDPRKRKSLSKKRQRQDPDRAQNRSSLKDSDFSPPRRSEKNSDFDEARRRKSSSKKRHRDNFNLVQDCSGSGDSDFSPRRLKKNSDSDEARRRKLSSKKCHQDNSNLVQDRSDSGDSDFNPPRRPKKNSDSDLSPPRNSKPMGKETDRKSQDNYSRTKVTSRYSSLKGANDIRRDSRQRNYNGSTSRTRSSVSSPLDRNNSHKGERNMSENHISDYHRKNQRSKEDRRVDENFELPCNWRKEDQKKSTSKHSRRGGKDSDSGMSPPRESKMISKNLQPTSNIPQKSKNYQQMNEETCGFSQAPVLRDKKTGRRRDLAAEAQEQKEKDGKKQELEEKYAQWGRGLKQVEDCQEKLNRDLYEMSKPLARYADDADLERELKAQEREGDPMLAYIRQKQVKEGKQEPEKPKYNGPSMPNRFGIRPGYRWDGVDRSNGYEKKWFNAQNARKAVQEEAYKWSTADM